MSAFPELENFRLATPLIQGSYPGDVTEIQVRNYVLESASSSGRKE